MSLFRQAISLDPSRPAHLLRWLPVLLVKLALFTIFLADNARTEHMGSLALRDGDTWEYVDPIESLLTGNGYDPDHRMPGYGAVWLLLRSILSYSAAASAITVLQLVLASLVIYLLAWSVYRLTSSARMFWIALGVLAVSTFHAKVEPWVMNESFTTSAIALHGIFFLKWKRDPRPRWLLWSGAALGWAVFMRPIYAPLLAVVPMILFFKRTAYWRERIVLPVMFLLPFILADVPWAWRNARVNHAFHPLTNGKFSASFEASPYFAAMKVLQCYGGNYNFWDPTADIRWFGLREHELEGRAAFSDANAPPPPYALIDGVTLDSLRAFAGLLARARDFVVPEAERAEASAAAHRWADRYSAAYPREHAFQYYVMAPLRYLRHLTVHSGTQVLFSRTWSDMPAWQKSMKLLGSALYLFAIIGGFIGALFLLATKRAPVGSGQLAVIVLFGILSHPFLVRLCEVRYLIPVYPLMVVTAVLAIHILLQRRLSPPSS